MSIFAAILGAVIGAAAGFGIGLALGAVLAEAMAISSFEGASGYFMGAIGLLGALIGCPVGIVIALRFAGLRRPGAIAGRGLAALGIIAAIVAAVVLYRLATVEHFSGASPRMHFEVRLPAGAKVPVRPQIDFEMQAGSQRSGGRFADPWLRYEDDRPVIGGSIDLYTRTSRRILVVSMQGYPRMLYTIRLPATPRPATEFGEWQRADYADDREPNGQPRRLRPEEAFEIRYFVPAWR